MAKADEPNGGSPTAKLGKWLAAGEATFVAVAAAIGLTSGGIQRIFRNQGGEAALWLAFIAFGILVGVLVSNGAAAGVKMRPGHLLFAGIGSLLVGIAALWRILPQEGPTSNILELVANLPSEPLAALIVLLIVAWLAQVFRGLPKWRLDPEHVFQNSWTGLFALGIAATWFVLLSGNNPDRRSVAAALGVTLIVTAIGIAANRKPEDTRPPPSSDDQEETINVNVRFGEGP